MKSSNRRHRMTRIVSTLGPASDTTDMIKALIEAGTNVFRLNMSHGSLDGKAQMIQNIRACEIKTDRPIAIMVDLQGPKIRIGDFEGGEAELAEGADFALCREKCPGDATRVTLPHAEVFQVLTPGAALLLDDGKIRLEVAEADDDYAKCKVMVGGTLRDRKGVNVPDAVLPVAALTDKDRVDLDFALEHDVDWIALSFVQRAEDIAEARKIVRGRAGVLAKIEKPAALVNLDEIIEISDAVMVARGDLGVEAPLEQVPGLQRRIIAAAREAGKPVVVATQMLESMIDSPVPTRAEVSDVASAVFDVTDAVMLSAESAAGKYPVEAVKVMDRVARTVEGDPAYRSARLASVTNPRGTAEDAISAAARQVARTVEAKAIVTFTTSGSTALRASRERPGVPILVLTPNAAIARRLTLVWGLRNVTIKDVESFEEMVSKSKRSALHQGLTQAGDLIVVTAGVPFGTPGSTNVLHIAQIAGNELDESVG